MANIQYAYPIEEFTRLRKEILGDAFGNDFHKRYDFPLFKESEIRKGVAEKGFHVAPLLNAEEVRQLREGYFRMLDIIPEGLPETFWPSGRSADPVVRNHARDEIEAVVPARLEKYFDRNVVDFVGGTYLIKPPSGNSHLYPHQDSAHVNEEKHFAVYAWVPLQDVNEENGALHVIPGSHLFGNHHRSLNVPWGYDGLSSYMLDFMETVNMKAGDVCFFDSATIHYSPNNLTKDPRLALNYFLMPLESPFLHYFVDENTPKDKVEVFNVDIDFFYNCDFEKRPPDTYPNLGFADHPSMNMSEERFKKLVEAYQSVCPPEFRNP